MESRRVDNQARGRSGRQGDEGSSVFYVSLEDDLMRIFGSESMNSMLEKLGLKDGESIDHPWINKQLFPQKMWRDSINMCWTNNYAIRIQIRY